jgi:hypothetical protein
MKFSTNENNKKYAPKIIFFKNKIEGPPILKLAMVKR